jgi:hypothetical protein
MILHNDTPQVSIRDGSSYFNAKNYIFAPPVSVKIAGNVQQNVPEKKAIADNQDEKKEEGGEKK